MPLGSPLLSGWADFKHIQFVSVSPKVPWKTAPRISTFHCGIAKGKHFAGTCTLIIQATRRTIESTPAAYATARVCNHCSKALKMAWRGPLFRPTSYLLELRHWCRQRMESQEQLCDASLTCQQLVPPDEKLRLLENNGGVP